MIVSWMTTNKCNLKCSHCYQDAGMQLDRELTTGEAKDMIDGIAGAGFRIMIFSGGEPLLRPDIIPLVQYASVRGLRPVFGTNGTLITPDAARNLKKAGASTMGISVDSLDEKKHNSFRGQDDAFLRTMEGIENCRRAGVPFQIHTTVMDWNLHEIPDLMDFAADTGAAAHYIFFLIPVGRAITIEDTSLQSMEYEETLRTIMDKQSRIPLEVKPTCAPQFTRVAQQMDIATRFARGCLAGLSYCVVGATGKLRPCAYMTEEAGDVREEPFDRIWKNSPLFRKLRSQAYGGSCGTCIYNGVCGGCRARAAYYHDGDILAEDSCCAYGQGMLSGKEETLR